MRAINIFGVVVFVLLMVGFCQRVQAETIEQISARVASMTGLPDATPPKGGVRVLPMRAIPRRHKASSCYYEVVIERITCREGKTYLMPHEVTHHLQKRAGWDFSNPDTFFVAQQQAWWVQRNYRRSTIVGLLPETQQ